MTPRRVFAIVLLVVGLTSACSSDDTSSMADCREIVRQAEYEALRQMAVNGHANDPAALVEYLKTPGESEGDFVDVPTYEAYMEQYDESERAQLLSALYTHSIGVGGKILRASYYHEMNSYGACAGDLN